MAEIARTLTDTLLARVRDPQGAATSRAQARLLLSHAQRIINLGMRVVANYTYLDTEPLRLLYPVQARRPLAGRVIGVRDAGGRDLNFVAWSALVSGDPRWFRAVGPQYETWSMAGRDLLCLSPAVLNAQSVQLVVVELTPELAGEDTQTDLPDEHLPAVLDLAEAVIHASMRAFDLSQAALARLATRLPEIARVQSKRTEPRQ